MNKRIEELIHRGKTAEIIINEIQAEKLIAYMDQLLERNKQINLTRIIDEDEFIRLHLLDSLTLLKLIKNPRISILDVGTGGGFPGIPLAIMLEEAKITLMDSTKKKLNVVQSIASELGINNINTLHGRAEELGQDHRYREKYEVVASRAVANLTLLSEYCLPLTKVGGQFLSMKGRDYQEELNAAQIPIDVLGGKITTIEKGLLLQSEFVHVIINIKKVKPTPANFPRIHGKIKKEAFPIQYK
ncbi:MULTISPECIES: 16S rRNA (guanine(527)-N(7))-methyltransferase RsmG [Acetobacterium]|jgi:16S rRNA (guanine527-N7)-methyltransferase|uniref:Ribosomal RNA small subunit methyltransferase G n=1 Tax=Acetobacterium wieringae TaxID=52694 RepID=A0A1F2PIQ3_9FIRM|nr:MULTISPECIES: 16S rRNA (guanine(527)-N(7))-methyltransferase RsmG [Acetobacterium]OFV71210.1 ribosomal RNA small subunit methyltransferase G [Acetobacterium wieringae]URN84434.1 16S rRNA (guanine(527)-N(7))-methyltransferase RsmG [Acetobacterium wieringae]